MHADTSRHHNPQVTDYNMAKSMTAYIRSGPTHQVRNTNNAFALPMCPPLICYYLAYQYVCTKLLTVVLVCVRLGVGGNYWRSYVKAQKIIRLHQKLLERLTQSIVS